MVNKEYLCNDYVKVASLLSIKLKRWKFSFAFFFYCLNHKQRQKRDLFKQPVCTVENLLVLLRLPNLFLICFCFLCITVSVLVPVRRGWLGFAAI